MDRPLIRKFFPEATTLHEAIKTYDESPYLFKYCQALDDYIDYLLESQQEVKEIKSNWISLQEKLWYIIKEEMVEAMNKCSTPEEWVQCMMMRFIIQERSEPPQQGITTPSSDSVKKNPNG